MSSFHCCIFNFFMNRNWRKNSLEPLIKEIFLLNMKILRISANCDWIIGCPYFSLRIEILGCCWMFYAVKNWIMLIVNVFKLNVALENNRQSLKQWAIHCKITKTTRRNFLTGNVPIKFSELDTRKTFSFNPWEDRQKRNFHDENKKII